MWCDGAWPCSAGRPAACLGHSGALAGACKGASLLHLHLVWECRPNNPCSCALSLRTNQSTSITSHAPPPRAAQHATREQAEGLLEGYKRLVDTGPGGMGGAYLALAITPEGAATPAGFELDLLPARETGAPDGEQ